MQSLISSTRPSVEDRARTARTVLRWAATTYGQELCLLSSMQDAVLIDLALTEAPDLTIVFLDTGYHFPETHHTRRAIEAHYDIEVTVIGPPPEDRPSTGGECCDTKPALLEQALDGRRAWLTGARRCETPERAALETIGTDRRGLTKVSPLAYWSDHDVKNFIDTNTIISNPLLSQGYDSIGCATCTTKPDLGSPRSGRWRGTTRTECGIHL